MTRLKSRLIFPITLSTALLALVSCSTPAQRGPAAALPPAFQDGLVPYAQKILAHVNAADFDSKECVSYLRNLQSEVTLMQPRELGTEMTAHADALIDLLWQTRLALHRRLPEFSGDCITEVRNTSRLLRFIEEFLAERKVHVTDLDPATMDFNKQDTPVLVDSPNYLKLVNPELKNFEFKNGDLMLARGFSFMSALISRIGDVSSQFSHVITVHVDKDTKKVETIEAYVGLGTGIYDIETALKNENVRLLLLRPKDQELAGRAADFMYAKAKAAIATGHPIPYDYKFDFVDHSALSCAEVPQYAFQEASGGKVNLPMYPSRISESPKFLGRIGMQAGTTFGPGDLEVDPRFDMLMEWRDLRLTRDERVKDSILSSMLGWIETKGYEFHDTVKSKMSGTIVWGGRKTLAWPLIQKALSIPDFSKEVPRNLFQSIVLVSQVGDIFLSRARAQDAAFEKQTGWPMTYQDLYTAFEEYRVQDLKLYQDPKTRDQSEFHFALHP